MGAAVEGATWRRMTPAVVLSGNLRIHWPLMTFLAELEAPGPSPGEYELELTWMQGNWAVDSSRAGFRVPASDATPDGS